MNLDKSKHIPGTDPKPDKGNDSDKRPGKPITEKPSDPHSLSN